MSELPSIDTIADWVNSGTPEGDRTSINVLAVSEGEEWAGSVRRSPVEGQSAYVGETSAATGHLAAAASVAKVSPEIRLHYPEVDRTASGPWIVLEPLEGALGTVSTGRAIVRITLSRSSGGRDARLAVDGERLKTVLEAARPEHEHYPVADDEDGVFTTGMSSYELSEVTGGAELTVRFELSTTPLTSHEAVRDRFLDINGVTAVEVDPVAGVERSDPDERIRGILQDASKEVLGEYRYEWLSNGADRFDRLPTCNKLAFGTSRREGPFTSDAYSAAKAVLQRTATCWEGAT